MTDKLDYRVPEWPKWAQTEFWTLFYLVSILRIVPRVGEVISNNLEELVYRFSYAQLQLLSRLDTHGN